MAELAPQVSSAVSAAHRSRLYALLAAAYRYPSEQFGDAISSGQFQRDVRQAVAGLPYELTTAGMNGASAGLPASTLPETYTRLFDVGSAAGPPCILYEAETGGGRMGVLADILRFYHFFGLRLSETERERPDHLATELEFLHWLTFQEASAAEAGDTAAAASYRAAERDFLAAHVQESAEQVTRGMVADSDPVYPVIAGLTAAFCARDLTHLQHEAPEGARSVTGNGTGLGLELRSLYEDGPTVGPYDLRTLRAHPLKWDKIVKATHLTNCWYQRACNFNLFVSDGVLLREEQVGNYPDPVDPGAPDFNPRGCQKGACFAQRTYDPARVKYPLKRIGKRGEGRWQRVSWDQALTEICDQLIDVLVADGPEAVIQGGGTRILAGASEALGMNGLFLSLGTPLPLANAEIGDGHQGAAVTTGKCIFSDSADNWFHAGMILVWGGNPSYTNIPNYHFISEGRYNGAKVVSVCPDYNPSAIHADLWVPVKIGTDAALALGLCQVIFQEKLFKEDFVCEQTDLPFLVRTDNGRFLREKDLKRGGREDAFYLFDQAAGQVVDVPRKTLALNGLRPALDGEYEVRTLQGPVKVRPVGAILQEKLNTQYTPAQVSAITGTPVSLIEQLAREIAATHGAVNISTSNWGKFYHGDLIERAMMLVFAVCGHMGHKGASFSAFPWLAADTDVGAWERQGRQLLRTAAASDPRYAAWKEDGYTHEMIITEYTKEAIDSGGMVSTTLVHLIHGGLLELHDRHNSWDPHLKRPVHEYVDESLDKGWHVILPERGKKPRVMFEWGGNVFKRARGTKQLLETLLPKLELVVTVDWRLSTTGLYSDYILPTNGWYERYSTALGNTCQTPFLHVNDKAIEPLYESVGDWGIALRLGKKIAERARERGIPTCRDRNGKEIRLDRLDDAVTLNGLYDEEDEEGVARDTFVNADNREDLDWEEFKARGIAAYTGPGMGVRSVTNACELVPGEPVVPLTWHVVRKDPWPTLTRRMQFYIDHDWYLELEEELPMHKDCPDAGGDYPLQVTGGHTRWSIHTDWIDDAIILGLQRGEPLMFMNAQDAAGRGVADSDFVEVYNDVGSFRIRVAVSHAARPGQVMIYHGWENYQFKDWQHFKTVMPSPVNPIELVGGYGHIRPDPMSLSPGPADRGSRVEVRKVD